jgi:hypothetical protein
MTEAADQDMTHNLKLGMADQDMTHNLKLGMAGDRSVRINLIPFAYSHSQLIHLTGSGNHLTITNLNHRSRRRPNQGFIMTGDNDRHTRVI